MTHRIYHVPNFKSGIFPSKSNRWFCYIMLAYTTAWLFGAFFLVLFQCWYVLHCVVENLDSF